VTGRSRSRTSPAAAPPAGFEPATCGLEEQRKRVPYGGMRPARPTQPERSRRIRRVGSSWRVETALVATSNGDWSGTGGRSGPAGRDLGPGPWSGAWVPRSRWRNAGSRSAGDPRLSLPLLVRRALHRLAPTPRADDPRLAPLRGAHMYAQLHTNCPVRSAERAGV
jgi:hypothetical protein